MLRLPQVVEATGLSETTIWRREKDGEFPSRRRLGSNIVAWRSDEIAEWIEQLPSADDGPEELELTSDTPRDAPDDRSDAGGTPGSDDDVA